MKRGQKAYEKKPERSYIQRKSFLNTSGVQTEGRSAKDSEEWVLRGTTFF